MSPPASFNRRETEEYDRRRASFSSARSSYAGSSSSSGTGFLSVKREWSNDEEEPAPFAFVPVKEEPEEPAPLGRRGVVGPEDYVADFDAVAKVFESPTNRRVVMAWLAHAGDLTQGASHATRRRLAVISRWLVAAGRLACSS